MSAAKLMAIWAARGLTWSRTDKAANVAITNNALTATGTGGAGSPGSGRGTAGRTTGKLYFAAHVDSDAGSVAVGLMVASASLAQYPGFAANTMGFTDSGAVLLNSTPIDSPGTFAAGDVVGIAVNLTTGHFWVQVNGVWINSGGTPNPTTDTLPYTGLTAGTYFPAIGLNGAGNGATLVAGTPPSGFASWR